MGSKKQGQYYQPHPLDFELLRRMPKEGAMLGFHTLGLTVAAALKELNKDVPRGAELTADQVSSRLRSMAVAGHVNKVALMGAGTSLGWQRTPKGTEHYEKHTGRKVEPNEAPNLRVVGER